MSYAPFVHLHLHTQYSLLDGQIRLKGLFKKAQAFNLPAIAMTDHGNLFGMVEFYKQAQKQGLKPIIGCEVYVTPVSRFLKENSPHQEDAFHLVLLSKNEKGYRNLVKLVTKAYFEGFHYKPRVDRELLREHHEGLIALSACLYGEIPSALLKGDKDRALHISREMATIFDQDRFYLELQKNDIPEQDLVNHGLLEIHRELGLPIVATNNCHYLTQEEARAHDVLLCIQTGKTLDDPDRFRFSTNQQYFKSPEEMITLFSDLPEAIENTLHIADRCNLKLTFGHFHIPRYPLAAEETIDGCFKKKARSGLEQRLTLKTQLDPAFPASRVKEYQDRLEREITVITSKRFSGYFFVVADYVNYAKARGIPVGPGRASVAGSLVAYSLGITDIDPLDYRLLFERFLSSEHRVPPDIDVDFCMERRDEVLKYITEKYGQEYVAKIMTFGKMQARGVIKYVGQALNIPYEEVDKITNLIPSFWDITLREALEEEPKLKELKDTDPTIHELLTLAEALEGLPSHVTTHAAAVVISPHPITDSVPLYKGDKEEILTQFEIKSVQEMGLIKFDLLGLNNLTIINYALKIIERTHGLKIDLKLIPLDDTLTYQLLARGDTTGVFQMESSGMKDLLIKSKPENFEDIIALKAMYRTGPLKSGMIEDYIKRKRREVPVEYLHPLLEGILKETQGIIVYQEQLMQIASLLADYSMEEANSLRKDIVKRIPEVMALQRTHFLEGARKKKIDQEKAEAIFDHMVTFSHSGFNKSHSAAYALITYQTAFLKAHYPLDFMVALMANKMGTSTEVAKCIAECQEKGIVVLPPDVNLSQLDFTLMEDKIRFGLAAVKNLGAGLIESILEARDKRDAFKSLIDFCKREELCRLNQWVVKGLIKCGAFDSLGVDGQVFDLFVQPPLRHQRISPLSLDNILEHKLN